MRLPHAESVVIDVRKIRDYILSLEHPVGRFKARYFLELGFTKQNWEELVGELRRIASEGEAVIAEGSRFGQKYVVHGSIVGRTGQRAEIVTVWIVLVGEEVPRFVTAYPET